MSKLTLYHDLVLVVMVSVLVLVSWFLTAFLSQNYFLGGSGDLGIKEDYLLEVFWTVLPAGVLSWLGFASLENLYLMEVGSNVSHSVEATGHQWYWDYHYVLDLSNLNFDFVNQAERCFEVDFFMGVFSKKSYMSSLLTGHLVGVEKFPELSGAKDWGLPEVGELYWSLADWMKFLFGGEPSESEGEESDSSESGDDLASVGVSAPQFEGGDDTWFLENPDNPGEVLDSLARARSGFSEYLRLVYDESNCDESTVSNPEGEVNGVVRDILDSIVSVVENSGPGLGGGQGSFVPAVMGGAGLEDWSMESESSARGTSFGESFTLFMKKEGSDSEKGGGKKEESPKAGTSRESEEGGATGGARSRPSGLRRLLPEVFFSSRLSPDSEEMSNVNGLSNTSAARAKKWGSDMKKFPFEEPSQEASVSYDELSRMRWAVTDFMFLEFGWGSDNDIKKDVSIQTIPLPTMNSESQTSPLVSGDQEIQTVLMPSGDGQTQTEVPLSGNSETQTSPLPSSRAISIQTALPPVESKQPEGVNSSVSEVQTEGVPVLDHQVQTDLASSSSDSSKGDGHITGLVLHLWQKMGTSGEGSTSGGDEASESSGTKGGGESSGEAGVKSGESASGEAGVNSGESASGEAGVNSGESASGEAGVNSGESASGEAGVNSGESASGEAGVNSGESASGEAAGEDLKNSKSGGSLLALVAKMTNLSLLGAEGEDLQEVSGGSKLPRNASDPSFSSGQESVGALESEVSGAEGGSIVKKAVKDWEGHSGLKKSASEGSLSPEKFHGLVAERRRFLESKLKEGQEYIKSKFKGSQFKKDVSGSLAPGSSTNVDSGAVEKDSNSQGLESPLTGREDLSNVEAGPILGEQGSESMLGAGADLGERSNEGNLGAEGDLSVEKKFLMKEKASPFNPIKSSTPLMKGSQGAGSGVKGLKPKVLESALDQVKDGPSEGGSEGGESLTPRSDKRVKSSDGAKSSKTDKKPAVRELESLVNEAEDGSGYVTPNELESEGPSLKISDLETKEDESKDAASMGLPVKEADKVGSVVSGTPVGGKGVGRDLSLGSFVDLGQSKYYTPQQGPKVDDLYVNGGSNPEGGSSDDKGSYNDGDRPEKSASTEESGGSSGKVFKAELDCGPVSWRFTEPKSDSDSSDSEAPLFSSRASSESFTASGENSSVTSPSVSGSKKSKDEGSVRGSGLLRPSNLSGVGSSFIGPDSSNSGGRFGPSPREHSDSASEEESGSEKSEEGSSKFSNGSPNFEDFSSKKSADFKVAGLNSSRHDREGSHIRCSSNLSKVYWSGFVSGDELLSLVEAMNSEEVFCWVEPASTPVNIGKFSKVVEDELVPRGLGSPFPLFMGESSELGSKGLDKYGAEGHFSPSIFGESLKEKVLSLVSKSSKGFLSLCFSVEIFFFECVKNFGYFFCEISEKMLCSFFGSVSASSFGGPEEEGGFGCSLLDWSHEEKSEGPLIFTLLRMGADGFFALKMESFGVSEYSEPKKLGFTGGFRLMDVSAPCFLSLAEKNEIKVSTVDVMHSWGVPDLGVKADAVPGRLNCVKAVPWEPGFSYGSCYELCGPGHSAMPIVCFTTSKENVESLLISSVYDESSQNFWAKNALKAEVEGGYGRFCGFDLFKKGAYKRFLWWSAFYEY